MSGSMLGLISLGPQGDAEAQERRAELVPATTGEVFGGAIAEGFQESVGPRMARIAGRGYIDQGGGDYAPIARGQTPFDDLSPSLPGQLISAFRRAFPGEQPLPPSPMVPLDVLKREYEIPGVLSFDKDTPQSVAQSLYEHKRDQMARADAVRRADNMLTQGMAARFVGSMIGSLADPVNIAAMFVPGLRESTVARMMGVGPGASALARAGVRAGAGASAGAAGMIALEPLNAALMAQERDDWTAAGALANVLFGTVAGAGFHSGLGALAERSRGLPDWAPARAFSEQMQNAAPEVQEALVRSTMASTIEGRPVVAAELLELHTALEREAAALRGEAAAVPLHGLDEITVARIQDVEAALAETAITAERRATLEAELAMLTEGQNPEIVALERARSEAQRQGLETAAARTEARFAEVDRQLDEATRPRNPVSGRDPWRGATAVSDAEGRPLRVFHGSPEAFDRFDSARLGGNTGANSARRGHFFAADPLTPLAYVTNKSSSIINNILQSVADDIAGFDMRKDVSSKDLLSADALLNNIDDLHSVVIEAAAKATVESRDMRTAIAVAVEKLTKDVDATKLYMRTLDEYEDGSNLYDWHRNSFQEGANVRPSNIRLRNPLVVDFNGRGRSVSFDSLLRRAEEEGRDGAIFKNVSDGGPSTDVYVVFDPDNIRPSWLADAERLRDAKLIVRDLEAAQRPNPADAMPPPATTRTGAAPPDPRPPGEVGAVAKDIAEIEKQTAEMDALLKVQNDELLSARIKEYDALVDEEARVDTALFDAAAACIVRTR